MHQQARNPVTHPRVQAHVKFFSRDKGYGFFKRANKEDIFFSSQELLKCNINQNDVSENDLFEFDLIPVQGKGGRAKNIKLITKAKKNEG